MVLAESKDALHQGQVTQSRPKSISATVWNDMQAARAAALLREKGKESEAKIVELKRAQARELELARATQLAKADEEWRKRLRGRIARLTCSMPWEDDLYQLLQGPRRDLAKDKADALARSLRNAALYPPGGFLTLMRRCDCCFKWVPPQAVLNSILCARCMRKRGMDFSEKYGEEGRCFSCGASHRAKIQVLRVVICVECDSNAMSDEQHAGAVGAHRVSHVIRERDVIAHQSGGGRFSRRRRQFQWDDPRSIGGPVDYQAREDGLLADWMEFKGYAAGEEVEAGG